MQLIRRVCLIFVRKNLRRRRILPNRIVTAYGLLIARLNSLELMINPTFLAA